MTQPEEPETPQEGGKPNPPADAEATVGAAENAAPEPEPEPEPWTAEKVVQWNAYYDLYVVLGVLLLAFVASANRISNSPLWSQLKAGELIAANGPFAAMTDVFSYTQQGQRWVNVPWLFEWGHALLHRTVQGLVPQDMNDSISSTRRSEQIAAGVLVGLTALIRVATVLVLLGIRRPGPGLWWTAVCATFAVAAAYGPLGVMIGGISGPAMVSPETWGQLFLAIELLLLHRSINLGRRGAVLGLVPLFLVWANVHESFLIGLVILAAYAVGRLVSRQESAADPFPFPKALTVLGACAAACLVNPSVHRVYLAALDPIVQLFERSTGVVSTDQLSYFGQGIRMSDQGLGSGLWRYLILWYLLCVTVGVCSFVLNRRHFSLGRFLAFVAAAVFWAMYIRLGAFFAVMFAATLALNGQEWYLDRFGERGRLGRGWALWSTGGRFVTILLVFLLAAKCLTGYGRSVGEPLFGFGFETEEFMFEASDFLRTAKLEGNVLNTTRLQGDSLIWRAYPERRTFIDGRQHLYPQELVNELHRTRLALAEDDVNGWKPTLDRYKISSVMIEPSTAPNTYRALMQSVNWLPFYDDGRVVLFGRADAPAGDLAFFKENRLDPERLAYRQDKPLPDPVRPPTPRSGLDEIFMNRMLSPSQSHTEASDRWLRGFGSGVESSGLPDPAHCLLAIREARIALARKPDDTQAYRLLAEAYRDLMRQEGALLSGLSLTDDRAAVSQIVPQPQSLMNRFRQRVTALNFAIQTTPPPRTEMERNGLSGLNLELFQLYSSVNFLDLARDRLKATLTYANPRISDDVRSQMRNQLDQLDNQIKQVQEGLDELRTVEQPNAAQRAQFALERGAPGLAIQDLEESLQLNAVAAAVKPQLIDIYCDTGQPEKALDLLQTSTSIDDPALGAEPGVAALRQGRVYYLLGNYEYASSLWEKHAIPQIRLERSFKALGAGQGLLRGEVKSTTTTFLNLQGKLNTQAIWENELGFCRLEAGQPTLAAKDLEHSLTLVPGLPSRAVTAYYLTKLGKTVPPLPKSPEAAAEDSKNAPDSKPENAPEASGEKTPEAAAAGASDSPKAKD